MSKTLEFYFDFGSPTAYLAHKRLQQLREQYGLEMTWGQVKFSVAESPRIYQLSARYQYQQPRQEKRAQVIPNIGIGAGSTGAVKPPNSMVILL